MIRLGDGFGNGALFKKLMKLCFGSLSLALGLPLFSSDICEGFTSKKVGCSFLRLVLLFLLSNSLVF